MTNGIKNGAWLQWAIGIVIILIIGWLSALTGMSQGYTPKEVTAAMDIHHRSEMLQSEIRLDARLNRIETKLDRLIERSIP